jgi:hypothetical protein
MCRGGYGWGRTGLALAVAFALLSVSPPVAGAQQERDCFWQGGNRSTNIAYPDLGARYWVSSFPLPPGAELILRGRYPHARYMSFNVYDAAAQPTDGLADVDIAPNPGSINPFPLAARRDAPNRDYTVRVVSGARPQNREPNTIYLNAGGQPNAVGVIMYRVYVPDTGKDAAGGTGLPEVSMRLPGGTELDQPATCQARADSGANQALESFHANSDGPGTEARNPTVEDPIRWEAFFNYFQAFSYPAGSTPASSGRDVLPREKLGGFLSNVDNAYTIAMANRGVGPVMVLRGRAPTTPRTADGRPVMEDGQVRYWSLCENEFASQRVIDCVWDEQVRTDAAGRFTIVMSEPGERPMNASPECGVNWIAWGVQPDGLLILRHMLPSVSFAQAIQRVSQPGTEQAVIGEYLPVGRHTTKARFEALGCAASGSSPSRRRASRPSCLARRSPIGPRNIGRVRVGVSRRAMLRRVGPRPTRRTRRYLRWCVKGGRGQVTAVFGSRGRSVLVKSTAARHGIRRLYPGTSVRRLRRSFPGARRISRTLFRAGARSPRLLVLRGAKVRYLAVFDRRSLRTPRAIRRYLRLG